MCNTFYKEDDLKTNLTILNNMCKPKCEQEAEPAPAAAVGTGIGPSEAAEGICKAPAYITDGFNFICICYCP